MTTATRSRKLPLKSKTRSIGKNERDDDLFYSVGIRRGTEHKVETVLSSWTAAESYAETRERSVSKDGWHTEIVPQPDLLRYLEEPKFAVTYLQDGKHHALACDSLTAVDAVELAEYINEQLVGTAMMAAVIPSMAERARLAELSTSATLPDGKFYCVVGGKRGEEKLVRFLANSRRDAALYAKTINKYSKQTGKKYVVLPVGTIELGKGGAR